MAKLIKLAKIAGVMHEADHTYSICSCIMLKLRISMRTLLETSRKDSRACSIFENTGTKFDGFSDGLHENLQYHTCD